MLSYIRKRLLSLPRLWKRALLVSFDFLALATALWVSFSLRFDRWMLPASLDEWVIIASAPLIAIPVFVRMGLYRAVVRYMPERMIWTIFQAMAIATILWVVVAFLSAMAGRGYVPRSVPIIYWVIGTLVITSSRFTAKWLFWPATGRGKSKRPTVVIYGAGEAGTQLAISLRSSHLVVGFLDDDPNLHRREVSGVRVYTPSHLPTLVRDYDVKQVILSIPSLTTARRREIVESMSQHHVKVQSLPALTDLATGKYLVSQIREIEIDDLLGRSSVPPDLGLIKSMIVGRTIMVTGAGGSIGSELCRKIAQWSPQRLVLFEANEFALYRIDRELADKDLAVVSVLGSVTDAQRVEAAIKEHGVDVLFHAAAHKHVPLVEANALEGIKNNVFGTKTVVDAAYRLGVQNFVLISTDKAVRPTNVMGATKRWAELIVREKAAEALSNNTGQKFCAVRFGNVLGSNGSVVPLFKEQIAQGGPLTLTDRAMTRYFMSIAEAAELIVQAGALSEGGDVFLLDMGEPVLVSDLAENMIRLAGFSVRSKENLQGDIEIVEIGKRPGEKLYEELFYDATSATPTKHPRILRGLSQLGEPGSIVRRTDELASMVADQNERGARTVLFKLIAERDSRHGAGVEPTPATPHLLIASKTN
ncbi:nucleoside-diphosphate sugar epimerase/dehydratase [Pelagibacterium mangrovi]|uniref:nucleoside-diphosphate sugar epimerase/dehydratase n=1 Tax=Pelagibacterium mangrovi TaxID=3119828 RepID=UPI002FC9396B